MVKGKLKKTFTDPLGKNNPVFAQILGICSTLAVTNKLENTVVMTLGVVFTTTLSSFVISLIRKWIPSRVRMMAETLIIASFVIIVDITLRAYMPDIWKQLGPYVGLIITNCIIMGRAEAFALNNTPGLSLIDGLASGIGYSYVLIIVAIFRELLGTGSLWGIKILGSWWTNWSIMIMPPGAFFMLAIFIWIVKGAIIPEKEEAKK
ncbi:NADH:ubiquinone reductase (Na(+)-transporting) subunit D [Sediminispirochaeta bajacaliforniensis]|jgi:Na+-transporting NADH:ubiquinone oxidoreductase subunit D|uniref:NADH:ubiquinone reductase (Na(+)-transporting) subunit D n=1 Tax=Sediminispirochaeta bajacaliforniensis TaxID=148 RepID=UPI00037C9F1D|nr:NADH:ubiquinone reductase (Na(+)-transporting) subunit D [Sediminispirochaeta bajacaliforniensis]